MCCLLCILGVQRSRTLTPCAARCADLGYKQLEISQLISKSPEVMAIPCRQIEDTHTQLGAICVSSPSDVRNFVTQDDEVLRLPLEPTQLAELVELSCDRTGQPPHTMLEAPVLFCHMQRCLMRLCFLRHQGRNLQPPYEELRMHTAYFCQLLAVSEEDLTAWCTTRILTPQGQRLNAPIQLLQIWDACNWLRCLFRLGIRAYDLPLGIKWQWLLFVSAQHIVVYTYHMHICRAYIYIRYCRCNVREYPCPEIVSANTRFRRYENAHGLA